MKRRYKWNGRRLLYNIAVVLAVAVINMFVLNLLYNIEDYSTIAKYQLENDLKTGDVQAAAYCQEKESHPSLRRSDVSHLCCLSDLYHRALIKKTSFSIAENWSFVIFVRQPSAFPW